MINYNQLAYEATMCLECWTVFGRWVKFSCITMSLFILILYNFIQYINGNKRLSLTECQCKTIMSKALKDINVKELT